MKKNLSLSFVLTCLVLIILGYNNCSFMFKTFGGSRELTVEHREMALQIFRSYEENIKIYFDIVTPYLRNSSKTFGRNKNISFDQFVLQFNEDMEEVIFDLENDLIYYYVADSENVGAAAYGGTATIKEEAFDNLLYFLHLQDPDGGIYGIDVNQAIKDNLWGAQMKRIFFDLIHEVDHTITPQGHAPSFSASNLNFVSMGLMDRTALLDHIFNGKDVTYHIERGLIFDLINLWHTTLTFRENRSQAGCVGEVVDIFNERVYSHSQGLDWYGLVPQHYESLASEICQVRLIPRDADEANFCSRTQEIQDAILGEWTCAEMRISDLENDSYLSLSRKGINNYQPGDFEYFSNVENLVMTGNNIADLPNNGFSGLSALTHMNLSSNPIARINQGSFNGLDNLESLFMIGTELSEIQGYSLAHLKSLIELKINGQNLARVQSASFAGLNELLVLDLSYSNISDIETSAFSHLHNIQELLFRHNELSELPSGWWMGINPNIQIIDFRNNNFSFDAKIEIGEDVQVHFPNAQLLI